MPTACNPPVGQLGIHQSQQPSHSAKAFGVPRDLVDFLHVFLCHLRALIKKRVLCEKYKPRIRVIETNLHIYARKSQGCPNAVCTRGSHLHIGSLLLHSSVYPSPCNAAWAAHHMQVPDVPSLPAGGQADALLVHQAHEAQRIRRRMLGKSGNATARLYQLQRSQLQQRVHPQGP